MKLIGLTQRVEIVTAYDERRDCLDQRWAKLLSVCGYKTAPLSNDKKAFYLDDCAGFILTGGNSLVKYGGNAPERDETDKFIIDYAIYNKRPLLGICRGMQSILDFFNAPLVNIENHVAMKHEINFGGVLRTVNSYHGQAALSIPPGCPLDIAAQTNDGVIEAVRHNEFQIEGVMWHPERVPGFDPEDIKLIRRLFG